MRQALLISVICLSSCASAEAQDWTMHRGGPDRTGRQALPAQIDTPAITFNLALGGGLRTGSLLLDDVDGDGAVEAVLIRGGRVVARRLDGTLIWATAPLAISSLHAIADLDGSGRPEVWASSSFGRIYALDGGGGTILFETREPAPEDLRRLGDLFPVDVDADGTDELYVSVFRSGSGTGRVYDFSAGFGSPTFTELDLSSHGYWRGTNQEVGDIDGDGLPELIALGHDEVIVYDLRSGLERWRVAVDEFPFARGVTSAADIDGDGWDEILIGSNDPAAGFGATRRLRLVELNEGMLQLRWALQVDARDGEHRFTRRMGHDVIVGGAAEIVTSLYEPGAGWTTIVIDGTATSSGDRQLQIAGRALLAIQDLDGDGVEEIVTIDASDRAVPPFGFIRAYRVEAGPLTAVQLWSVASASLALRPTPWKRDSVLVHAVGGGVLLASDSDGDGRADTITAVDSATGRELGVRTFPAGVAAVGFQSAEISGVVAVSGTDGRIEQLGPGLSVLNDGDGDGEADLREQVHLATTVRVLAGAAGSRIATVGGSMGLLTYDLAGAGAPVSPLWLDPSVVAGATIAGSSGHVVQWLPSSDDLLAFVRSTDGALLIQRFTRAGMSVEALTLSSLANVRPGNDILPLSGPGTLQLLVSTLDGSTNEYSYARLGADFADSTGIPELSRTVSCTSDRPAAAHDLDGDGVDDALLTQGNRLRAISGSTGALLVDVDDHGHCGGIISVVDADADGVDDLIQSGGFGVHRLTSVLAPSWSFEPDVRQRAAAVVPVSGAMHIGVARLNSSVFRILEAADGRVVSSLVLAGGRRFDDEDVARMAGVPLGSLSDVVSSDDLTGADVAAFVIGSTDGYLYAVSASEGTLLWTINMHALVGSPVIADVDDDGRAEVVVPVGDGSLSVIDRAALAGPHMVYDTDGTIVAASEDEDLDVLSSSTTVGANWEPVAGATQYEYQLVRDDGVVVIPWTSVRANVRYARSDLALQTGRRHYHYVRASDRSGSAPRVSPDAISDGFVVVDDAPPRLVLTTMPGIIWIDGPGPHETMIDLGMMDEVRLDAYSLVVQDEAATEVRELARRPIGGTRLSVSRHWDATDMADLPVAPGRFRVVATVSDAAGMTTTAEAPVTVCSVGFDLLECSEPIVRPPLPELTWQVRGGCECDVARGQRSASPWWPLLVAAVLLRLWRRRR